MRRKATQKASVGGWAEERLPERRAARSKSAMALDKSAAWVSGRTLGFGGWRMPSVRSDAYSLSETLFYKWNNEPFNVYNGGG